MGRSLAIVFAFFVAFAAANEEGSGTDSGEESASAVSTFSGTCYQCNSRIDAECADTEALKENENRFLRQCPTLTTANGLFHEAEAIGCRKAVQIVEAVDDGYERINRECAYGGKNVYAQKKTGNKARALEDRSATREAEIRVDTNQLTRMFQLLCGPPLVMEKRKKKGRQWRHIK